MCEPIGSPTGEAALASLPEPVRAVVSVWTDRDPGSVTEVLAALPGGLAGWEVEENEPLPPPHTDDGVRAEALANVALLRVPKGMGREVWLERWQGGHTRVAIETQATFGYVQNLVVGPVTEGQVPVDALVEELFPLAALTDLHAHITHPDVTKPLVLYGTDFTPAELPEIPSRDFPMGLPAWMRSTDFWASMSNPPGNERANISIAVP